MPRSDKNDCLIPGCRRVIADNGTMCRNHWSALPRELRTRIRNARRTNDAMAWTPAIDEARNRLCPPERVLGGMTNGTR